MNGMKRTRRCEELAGSERWCRVEQSTWSMPKVGRCRGMGDGVGCDVQGRCIARVVRGQGGFAMMTKGRRCRGVQGSEVFKEV